MGGLLHLVEDRPTPKAVYNWRVWACACVASFASCMIGYDSAFIGTTLALPSFTKEFAFASMTPEHLALVKANIVSVYQAGAFFGSLFAYVSSYFLGRKNSLYIFAPIFLLGAGLMLGATGERGLGLIYGGRVLAGIGVGGASMIVPIYISEIAPPAVRGALVGIYELGWQIGGLVGFWINYGISETLAPSHSQWLIPFAVQLIPGGLLFVGAFWLHESPRWLLGKGRRELAIKNLCWIRNLDENDMYIIEEVAFIDAAIEQQRATMGAGFWKVRISTHHHIQADVLTLLSAVPSGRPQPQSPMALLSWWHALLMAKRLWHQRNQLLFAYSLQIYRHSRDQHFLLDNGHFRRC